MTTSGISGGGERLDPDFSSDFPEDDGFPSPPAGDGLAAMSGDVPLTEEEIAMAKAAEQQKARDNANTDSTRKPVEQGKPVETVKKPEEVKPPVQETTESREPSPNRVNLDLLKPFWMTIYVTENRKYIDYFQDGDDPENDAIEHAADKATTSERPVAVFGPQKAIYSLPAKVLARPLDLPWAKD